MTNWFIQQAGFSSTKKILPKSWRARKNQYLRPKRNGKKWGKFRMSCLLRAWFGTATGGCFTTALPTKTSASQRRRCFKRHLGRAGRLVKRRKQVSLTI